MLGNIQKYAWFYCEINDKSKLSNIFDNDKGRRKKEKRRGNEEKTGRGREIKKKCSILYSKQP